MCKIDITMVEEAKHYVMQLLEEKLSEKLYYHGMKHTLDVLKNAEIIGEYCKLNTDELNIVKLSAIFHDVGYIDVYTGHEEASAKYARDFLSEKHVAPLVIKQVENAIRSTKVPQLPKDRISEILCDADLMYLANKDTYFTEAELLRQEWHETGDSKMSNYEFYKTSLEFFNSHQFKSAYGKNILQPKKEYNAKIIRDRISTFNNKSIL